MARFSRNTDQATSANPAPADRTLSAALASNASKQFETSGESTMWTHSTSIATTATPEALWRLFEDVAGWTDWNAGIERVALNGPFAAGTTFDMKAPGMDEFRSTLRDVRPNAGFVDETVLEGTRFLVSHDLQRLPSGGTRVTYAITVEGPEAQTLGPLVTADFPEVLAALKALAERAPAEVVQ